MSPGGLFEVAGGDLQSYLWSVPSRLASMVQYLHLKIRLASSFPHWGNSEGSGCSFSAGRGSLQLGELS